VTEIGRSPRVQKDGLLVTFLTRNLQHDAAVTPPESNSLKLQHNNLMLVTPTFVASQLVQFVKYSSLKRSFLSRFVACAYGISCTRTLSTLPSHDNYSRCLHTYIFPDFYGFSEAAPDEPSQFSKNLSMQSKPQPLSPNKQSVSSGGIRFPVGLHGKTTFEEHCSTSSACTS